MTFNAAEAERHLTNCFPPPWPGVIQLEIAYQPNQKTYKKQNVIPLRSPQDISMVAQSALHAAVSNGLNFYYTCSWMDNESKREKKNVVGTHILWADKDDIDEAEVAPIVRGCPIKPTGWVRSGGGYHFYWLLDGFYEGEDVVKGLKKAQSWVKGDPVTNLNRILALPGSLKFKPWKYPQPLPVYIVFWDPTKNYSLEEIIKTTISLPEINLPAEFKDLYILRGECVGEHTDRSTRDFAVVKELLRAGHNKDEIREIFHNPLFGCSSKTLERGGTDYFQKTYLSALAETVTSGADGVRDDGKVVWLVKVARNGTSEESVISNFMIEPLEILELEEENEFVMNLKIKCGGLERTVQSTGKYLAGVKMFIATAGMPGLAWMGTDVNFMTYLAYIRNSLPHHKVYKATRTYGWFRGGIVTPRKVLGSKEELRFFDSGENIEITLTGDKSIDFKEWMKALYDTLYHVEHPQVAFYAFGWFAAALFAPQIRKAWDNQFPLLCLSGEPGCGKTTMATFFNRVICGVKSDTGFKSTSAGLRRRLTATNCFPIVVDDYESNKHGQELDDYLRQSWLAGNKTLVDIKTGNLMSRPMTSPVCLTTMFSLTDEALADRILNLRIRVHDRPKGSRAALNWFRAAPTGYFARKWVLTESPREIIKATKEAYLFAEDWHPGATDRQLVCHAIPLGVLSYCNMKYWGGGLGHGIIKDWGEKTVATYEKETPEHLLDIFLAWVIRPANIHDSGFVHDFNWRMQQGNFVIHQAQLMTLIPRVQRLLNLPPFFTVKWVRELMSDLIEKKAIHKKNHVVAFKGSGNIGCISLYPDAFPLLREAISEAMVKAGSN